MARVARDRVVICDNTFVSESSEEADRLRDPSHVRNYCGAGVAQLLRARRPRGRRRARHRARDATSSRWLDARALRGRGGGAACARCSATASVDGRLTLPTVVLKGVKALDGDHRRQRHAARRPGAHRQRGPLPRPAQQGLRHERRRRRHAGQGRPGRRGHPRLQHGRRRRRQGGREHVAHLRAGPLRGRRDLRGGRRRHRHRHLHHRARARCTRCCAPTRTSARRGSR